MGISQRLVNLIKDNSCRGAKWLLGNSSYSASRKPSAVGSRSESLLNLIVDNSFAGFKSLHLVDLRSQLFFNTATPLLTFGEGPESAVAQDTTSSYTQAADADDLMKLAEVAGLEWLQLPTPIFSFEATEEPDHYEINCIPLTDHKVVIMDHSRHTFLFDADMRHAGTMPNLHKAKEMPISLFVPSVDPDALNGGGSLYVMEKIPKPEVGGRALSDQFEAMVFKPAVTTTGLSADCRLLPPPPFVRDPAYHRYPYPRITAYAVIGSNICISVDQAGTYCLDMLRNTWDKVGEWTLPFYGKVEYVPELKLWFGLSMKDNHLAAADLSDMNSQPQLIVMDSSKELDPPEEWHATRDSQLVNLGSGRFCIARFFQTLSMDDDSIDESIDEVNQIFVFTGVEVIPPGHVGNSCGNGSGAGKVKLDIRKHKSRCYISDCTTKLAVF